DAEVVAARPGALVVDQGRVERAQRVGRRTGRRGRFLLVAFLVFLLIRLTLVAWERPGRWLRICIAQGHSSLDPRAERAQLLGRRLLPALRRHVVLVIERQVQASLLWQRLNRLAAGSPGTSTGPSSPPASRPWRVSS